MLRRIILGLAIAAGLAAVGVNIGVVRPKIMQLQADRDAQRSAKVEAQTQLAQTKKTLAATQAELVNTKTRLAQTTSVRPASSIYRFGANRRIDMDADTVAK